MLNIILYLIHYLNMNLLELVFKDKKVETKGYRNNNKNKIGLCE